MAARVTVRTWATPLTTGAFLLMAGTGILMFFECERGLMTVVHQWFSWLFVVGAICHIVANIRPFQSHLKARWGSYSVAVFAVILAASFFSWGQITGPQLERPIELALVGAPLSALADVTGQSQAELLEKLRKRGIEAQAHQSVQDLARLHDIDENRALAIIFDVEG
ncbi:hypothetical protein FHX15_000778 [Rhizobium sp. BK650]|uniref:DUF4405 domain-containing protein n=1 Tax=Rhizobium sp. BK650 TaxID=2586990 RepID=UPI00161414FC|nr:DUF4405 domain-containing protein [Rhizobium sp. BK650]MBB3655579.1 hypothetical protein [Rhizobium sp. BK650]